MIYIHTSTINNRKNRFYCYKLNVFTLFCTKDEKTSTNVWPSDNVRIESYFVETYFTVNVKLKWPHYYAIITVVIVVVTIIIYYLLNNRRDFLIYHRQRHYLLNGTAIFLSSFNLVFKRKPFCHLNYHTQYLNIIHLFGSIYYIEPIKTTNDNDDVHEGTMEWMLPLLKCKLICWNRVKLNYLNYTSICHLAGNVSELLNKPTSSNRYEWFPQRCNVSTESICKMKIRSFMNNVQFYFSNNFFILLFFLFFFLTLIFIIVSFSILSSSMLNSNNIYHQCDIVESIFPSVVFFISTLCLFLWSSIGNSIVLNSSQYLCWLNININNIKNFIRNRMSPLCRSVAAEPDNNEHCDCGVVNMEYKIPLFTSNYKCCDPLRTKSANSSMLIKCLLALLLLFNESFYFGI